MKESKRVQIEDMQNRLQASMNYKRPADAFKVLLDGYAHHKRRKSGWVGRFLRQGWMSPKIAAGFAEYCGYPIDKNA